MTPARIPIGFPGLVRGKTKGRFCTKVVLANVPSFRFWGSRSIEIIAFFCQGSPAGKDFLEGSFGTGAHLAKPPFWKPPFCKPTITCSSYFGRLWPCKCLSPSKYRLVRTYNYLIYFLSHMPTSPIGVVKMVLLASGDFA